MLINTDKFLKKIFSIFIVFFIIISLMYNLFIFLIPVDYKYKKNVLDNLIKKENIYDLIGVNKKAINKGWGYLLDLNFYNVIITKKGQKQICIANNIKKIQKKVNLQKNIINKYNYLVCYQHWEYYVNINFGKKYFLLVSYLYISILSLIFLLVVFLSDPYFIIHKNTKRNFFTKLFKTGLFDKNELIHIEP